MTRTVMFRELHYSFDPRDSRLVCDKLVPAELQSKFRQLWALSEACDARLGESGGVTYLLSQGTRVDNVATLFTQWPKPFASTFIEAEEKRVRKIGFRCPVKLCPNTSGDARLDELLLDNCHCGDNTWQQVLAM